MQDSKKGSQANSRQVLVDTQKVSKELIETQGSLLLPQVSQGSVTQELTAESKKYLVQQQSHQTSSQEIEILTIEQTKGQQSNREFPAGFMQQIDHELSTMRKSLDVKRATLTKDGIVIKSTGKINKDLESVPTTERESKQAALMDRSLQSPYELIQPQGLYMSEQQQTSRYQVDVDFPLDISRDNEDHQKAQENYKRSQIQLLDLKFKEIENQMAQNSSGQLYAMGQKYSQQKVQERKKTQESQRQTQQREDLDIVVSEVSSSKNSLAITVQYGNRDMMDPVALNNLKYAGLIQQKPATIKKLDLTTLLSSQLANPGGNINQLRTDQTKIKPSLTARQRSKEITTEVSSRESSDPKKSGGFGLSSTFFKRNQMRSKNLANKLKSSRGFNGHFQINPVIAEQTITPPEEKQNQDFKIFGSTTKSVSPSIDNSQDDNAVMDMVQGIVQLTSNTYEDGSQNSKATKDAGVGVRECDTGLAITGFGPEIAKPGSSQAMKFSFRGSEVGSYLAQPKLNNGDDTAKLSDVQNKMNSQMSRKTKIQDLIMEEKAEVEKSLERDFMKTDRTVDNDHLKIEEHKTQEFDMKNFTQPSVKEIGNGNKISSVFDSDNHRSSMVGTTEKKEISKLADHNAILDLSQMVKDEEVNNISELVAKESSLNASAPGLDSLAINLGPESLQNPNIPYHMKKQSKVASEVMTPILNKTIESGRGQKQMSDPKEHPEVIEGRNRSIHMISDKYASTMNPSPDRHSTQYHVATKESKVEVVEVIEQEEAKRTKDNNTFCLSRNDHGKKEFSATQTLFKGSVNQVTVLEKPARVARLNLNIKSNLTNLNQDISPVVIANQNAISSPQTTITNQRGLRKGSNVRRASIESRTPATADNNNNHRPIRNSKIQIKTNPSNLEWNQMAPVQFQEKAAPPRYTKTQKTTQNNSLEKEKLETLANKFGFQGGRVLKTQAMNRLAKKQIEQNAKKREKLLSAGDDKNVSLNIQPVLKVDKEFIQEMASHSTLSPQNVAFLMNPQGNGKTRQEQRFIAKLQEKFFKLIQLQTGCKMLESGHQIPTAMPGYSPLEKMAPPSRGMRGGKITEKKKIQIPVHRTEESSPDGSYSPTCTTRRVVLNQQTQELVGSNTERMVNSISRRSSVNGKLSHNSSGLQHQLYYDEQFQTFFKLMQGNKMTRSGSKEEIYTFDKRNFAMPTEKDLMREEILKLSEEITTDLIVLQQNIVTGGGFLAENSEFESLKGAKMGAIHLNTIEDEEQINFEMGQQSTARIDKFSKTNPWMNQPNNSVHTQNTAYRQSMTAQSDVQSSQNEEYEEVSNGGSPFGHKDVTLTREGDNDTSSPYRVENPVQLTNKMQYVLNLNNQDNQVLFEDIDSTHFSPKRIKNVMNIYKQNMDIGAMNQKGQILQRGVLQKISKANQEAQQSDARLAQISTKLSGLNQSQAPLELQNLDKTQNKFLSTENASPQTQKPQLTSLSPKPSGLQDLQGSPQSKMLTSYQVQTSDGDNRKSPNFDKASSKTHSRKVDTRTQHMMSDVARSPNDNSRAVTGMSQQEDVDPLKTTMITNKSNRVQVYAVANVAMTAQSSQHLVSKQSLMEASQINLMNQIIERKNDAVQQTDFDSPMPPSMSQDSQKSKTDKIIVQDFDRAVICKDEKGGDNMLITDQQSNSDIKLEKVSVKQAPVQTQPSQKFDSITVRNVPNHGSSKFHEDSLICEDHGSPLKTPAIFQESSNLPEYFEISKQSLDYNVKKIIKQDDRKARQSTQTLENSMRNSQHESFVKNDFKKAIVNIRKGKVDQQQLSKSIAIHDFEQKLNFDDNHYRMVQKQYEHMKRKQLQDAVNIVHTRNSKYSFRLGSDDSNEYISSLSKATKSLVEETTQSMASHTQDSIIELGQKAIESGAQVLNNQHERQSKMQKLLDETKSIRLAIEKKRSNMLDTIKSQGTLSPTSQYDGMMPIATERALMNQHADASKPTSGHRTLRKVNRIHDITIGRRADSKQKDLVKDLMSPQNSIGSQNSMELLTTRQERLFSQGSQRSNGVTNLQPSENLRFRLSRAFDEENKKQTATRKGGLLRRDVRRQTKITEAEIHLTSKSIQLRSFESSLPKVREHTEESSIKLPEIAKYSTKK